MLLYSPGQSKTELLKKLILKPWTRYCQENWLSENHNQPYSPEVKVKRLLDRCATLLLRDVPKGKRNTLTSYKEMIVGSREINVSDCPEGIARWLEDGSTAAVNMSADDRLRYGILTEKLDAMAKVSPNAKAGGRQKQSTRFDRLERIKRDYPGCELHGCRVDVDGVFVFKGKPYQIDRQCAQYAPRKTRYGEQYDMDRVIVIALPSGDVFFADQDGRGIENDRITICEVVM